MVERCDRDSDRNRAPSRVVRCRDNHDNHACHNHDGDNRHDDDTTSNDDSAHHNHDRSNDINEYDIVIDHFRTCHDDDCARCGVYVDELRAPGIRAAAAAGRLAGTPDSTASTTRGTS